MAARKAGGAGPGGLPSEAEILRFIEEAASPSVGRREIARAFGIRGAQRAELRALLADMGKRGLLGRPARKSYGEAGGLPAVTVLEVAHLDEEGIARLRPVPAEHRDNPARITLPPERVHGPPLALRDRLLARLEKDGSGYRARILRRLPSAPDRVLGRFRAAEAAGLAGGPARPARIEPVDKKARQDFVVPADECGKASDGDLVTAEILPGRRAGLREARVLEVIGDLNRPRAFSLIALHEHDIPHRFPDRVLAEAEAARPTRMNKQRRDLRTLPIVTIDGADARDFDDAVHAEALEDGGWQVTVAIADVAWYVRPDGALDREALKRGNSVYFPDRVVPMLPERLSNDLCSLRPGENRPVLAVSMRFDADGNRKGHRFERAMIRSAARLTYEQVQAAIEGRTDETTGPLLDPVIRPLYGAFEALMRARARRQPLEIDLPELKVEMDDDGNVTGVAPRPRFDSHRLIEEFMVMANVCAAESLEGCGQPCMYRVHEAPTREKVQALRDFLRTIGFSLSLGERPRPELFNRVLAKAAGSAHAETVNVAILRSQTQALYQPDNLGHFGLALGHYAHFTSPIRRYADLLVHRALIRGLGLGPGGLDEREAGQFAAIGEAISGTERRAMLAERATTDRYLAHFMAQRIDAEFDATISGVTRAGLFVRLTETGADGLLPISLLGQDYFQFDETAMALRGRSSKQVYRLGDRLRVRLTEARPIAGGLLFALAGGGDGTHGKEGRRGPHNPGRNRKPGRGKRKGGGKTGRKRG